MGHPRVLQSNRQQLANVLENRPEIACLFGTSLEQSFPVHHVSSLPDRRHQFRDLLDETGRAREGATYGGRDHSPATGGCHSPERAPGAVRCRAARADALAAGHGGARSAQRLDLLQDGIRRRRACRSGDATRMGWQLRSGHHQRGMVAPGRLDVHPHRAAAADREHSGARAGGTGRRAPGRPRDLRTRVPGRGDHRQRTGSLRAAAGDRHGALGSHPRDLRTDGWGDPVEPPATVRRHDSAKGHDSFRTGCGDLPALHAGRRRLRQQGADCRLRDRSDRRPGIDEGNRRTHAVAAARRFSRGDRAGAGRRPRNSVTRPLRRTDPKSSASSSSRDVPPASTRARSNSSVLVRSKPKRSPRSSTAASCPNCTRRRAG